MPGDVPKKVEDIVKALKRDNPDWEEEKYWKIAWGTYNKMSENIYLGEYAYLSEKKKRKVLPSDPPLLPQDTDEDSELPLEEMASLRKTTRVLLDLMKTSFRKGEHTVMDVSQFMPVSKGFVLDRIIQAARDLEKKGHIKFDGKNLALQENVGNDFGIGFKGDIMKFFVRNPYPDDKQVHDFAGELGISHEELEREIYALLTDLLQER